MLRPLTRFLVSPAFIAFINLLLLLPLYLAITEVLRTLFEGHSNLREAMEIVQAWASH